VTFPDDIEVCPACGKRVISISMEDLYEKDLPEGEVCENDPHYFHPTPEHE
jgi:hypothetical protein